MGANSKWTTPEQIVVKSNYQRQDLEGVPHLGTLPGEPPYVRGPYASMYVGRPWTIRQYAGFSTATESNAFYRRNLEAGQKGLSSVKALGRKPVIALTWCKHHLEPLRLRCCLS